MKEKNLCKRFSVDIGGRIIAVFDSLEEAMNFLDDSWWLSMATIYDHEKQRDVLTEIRIGG